MHMQLETDIKSWDITRVDITRTSQSSIQNLLRAVRVGLGPTFTCITWTVLQVVLLRMALTRAKIVTTPPLSAQTTDTIIPILSVWINQIFMKA